MLSVVHTYVWGPTILSKHSTSMDNEYSSTDNAPPNMGQTNNYPPINKKKKYAIKSLTKKQIEEPIIMNQQTKMSPIIINQLL